MPINPESTVEFYKQVLLFNQLAGNDKREPEEALALQKSLCEEEWKETLEAFEKRDAVEFLDGIIDSLVVNSYLYSLAGNTNSLLDSLEVMADSFSWHPVTAKVRNTEFIGSLEGLCNTLKDEYQVDIEGAMAEVMRSNMSKFEKNKICNEESLHDMLQSLSKRCSEIEKNNKGRYTGVHTQGVSTEDGDYIVFKDSNGKVMKGPTFSEPDLKPYVGNLQKFFEDEHKKVVRSQVEKRMDIQRDPVLGEQPEKSDEEMFFTEPSPETLDMLFNKLKIETEDLHSRSKGYLLAATSEPLYGIVLNKREMEVLHGLTGMTLSPDNTAQDLHKDLDMMLYGEDGQEEWVDRFTVWDAEVDREYPYCIELREKENV